MTRVLVTTLVFAAASLAADKVQVQMSNRDGKPAGTVTISPAKSGVSLKGKITGLTPGTHAFHIHQNPACVAPDFTSAGPHYNPTKKKHGHQNPEGHHVGDLNNITADAKGVAKINATVADATLTDQGNSLFANGGTALVIHAKADDGKTDPAGAAGDRIACGVIKK